MRFSYHWIHDVGSILYFSFGISFHSKRKRAFHQALGQFYRRAASFSFFCCLPFLFFVFSWFRRSSHPACGICFYRLSCRSRSPLRCFVVLSFFVRRAVVSAMVTPELHPKSTNKFKETSNIDPNTFQSKLKKLDMGSFSGVMGAGWAPGGANWLWLLHPWMLCRQKMVLQQNIFGLFRNPKWLLEYKSALWVPKMFSKRGFEKT